MGLQGLTGATGATGPIGPQGPTGATGAKAIKVQPALRAQQELGWLLRMWLTLLLALGRSLATREQFNTATGFASLFQYHRLTPTRPMVLALSF